METEWTTEPMQLPYNNHNPFSQQEITLPVNFSSQEAGHDPLQNFMSCKFVE
jgi:hypothetical protein